MYREGPSPLAQVLEGKLSPFGFRTVEPDASLAKRGVRRLFHRKTWNTNRGVVLAAPGALVLDDYIERMRHEAGPFLGSSWWSQLGLQVVLTLDGRVVPSEGVLARFVDAVNSQGILIQSVFAIDEATGEWSQARTWGQFVTGKYQDAIQAALVEHAARR
jgi:hypothetical protein